MDGRVRKEAGAEFRWTGRRPIGLRSAHRMHPHCLRHLSMRPVRTPLGRRPRQRNWHLPPARRPARSRSVRFRRRHQGGFAYEEPWIWAAVCLPDLLVGSGANATPEACPQDQMRRADGQYISNTGKGQSGQSPRRHCGSGSCAKWFRCGAELGQVGECLGIDTFGELAPAEMLYEHFHLTVDGVESVVRKALAEAAGRVGEFDDA